MFKDSWNLHFSEWSIDYGDWFSTADNPHQQQEQQQPQQPVILDGVFPSGSLAGWFRQRRNNIRAIEEEPYPKDLKTPRTLNFSFSYDEDDHFFNEDEEEMETKINRSPLEWLLLWFHNRGTVQKVLYVLGAFGFLVILLALSFLIDEDMSHKDTSSASGVPEFTFPDEWVHSTPGPTTTTSAPTKSPNILSPPPIFIPEPHTYIPGNLTTAKFGLLLSEGLDANIIAFSNERVNYHDGGRSIERFHKLPDAGATFPDERPENHRGWIYVSNSEVENAKGGVGALTFDKDGNILHYEKLLFGTSMNCGGGRTPWNTWVSCEENGSSGQIFQVHPTGERKPQLMTLGRDGGSFESFAYDVRNQEYPSFFVTEDAERGVLRRFIPDSPNWNEPWEMLHGNGTVDYLMLVPNSTHDGGMFVWTPDKEAGKMNAELYYPSSEGIDVSGSTLYFVCKNIKKLFTLDLDKGMYHSHSTMNGLFDGQPDQMARVISPSQDLLYFTEENGENPGVHARDPYGNYHTVFESPTYRDETTGLSFSPDGMFMYIAYQNTGLLFSIWRTDGYSFHAAHLDVKYHHDHSLVP